jgi:hypothetical protein
VSLEPTRTSNGRWRRGHSGNPAGRRAETDPERRRVKELARECTEEAVQALREIMLDPSTNAMARVRAAEAILARGWGTATDEATLATLERGQDEANVIHFRMPMSLDGDEIEADLTDDDEPPPSRQRPPNKTLSTEPAPGTSDRRPRTAAKDESLDRSARAKTWVEKSCAEQGVPVKMTDPVALAKIADILASGREKRSSSERARLGSVPE